MSAPVASDTGRPLRRAAARGVIGWRAEAGGGPGGAVRYVVSVGDQFSATPSSKLIVRPRRGVGPAARGGDDECHGSPDVRARRADRGPSLTPPTNPTRPCSPSGSPTLGHLRGTGGPLGLVAAEVVDTVFYNFAPGEVARHIPRGWHPTTPEAAIAARQMGCVKALRRILADGARLPWLRPRRRTVDLAVTGPRSWPGPCTASLRRDVPRTWWAACSLAASLLRGARGDGHIPALMTEGVGGLEAHVLFALDMDMPAQKFGRIHHPPAAQLAAVIDGMRHRGLIGDDGWLSQRGRAVKQRVEALTDDLAAKPYETLEPDELDELISALEPLATLLLAAQD